VNECIRKKDGKRKKAKKPFKNEGIVYEISLYQFLELE
jgi:hypothetical protein